MSAHQLGSMVGTVLGFIVAGAIINLVMSLSYRRSQGWTETREGTDCTGWTCPICGKVIKEWGRHV